MADEVKCEKCGMMFPSDEKMKEHAMQAHKM